MLWHLRTYELGLPLRPKDATITPCLTTVFYGKSVLKVQINRMLNNVIQFANFKPVWETPFLPENLL